MQISNQPITWQKLNAFSQDDLLKFKLSIRRGERCVLFDFQHDMVVGAMV